MKKITSLNLMVKFIDIKFETIVVDVHHWCVHIYRRWYKLIKKQYFGYELAIAKQNIF